MAIAITYFFLYLKIIIDHQLFCLASKGQIKNRVDWQDNKGLNSNYGQRTIDSAYQQFINKFNSAFIVRWKTCKSYNNGRLFLYNFLLLNMLQAAKISHEDKIPDIDDYLDDDFVDNGRNSISGYSKPKNESINAIDNKVINGNFLYHWKTSFISFQLVANPRIFRRFFS